MLVLQDLKIIDQRKVGNYGFSKTYTPDYYGSDNK